MKGFLMRSIGISKARLKFFRVFVIVTLFAFFMTLWPNYNAIESNENTHFDYFKANKAESTSFIDVNANDWFYPYINSVSEMKLMIGTGFKEFQPLGLITIAESVTIAARLHSIYYTGEETFVQNGTWYQVYLDYAKKEGIVCNEMLDYNRQATRAEFAEIIASAFPLEALSEINRLTDTAIPDVTLQMPFGQSVYRLYRAGILTGNDMNRTFSPNSSITRSEVAAIIARMANPKLRVTLVLNDESTIIQEESTSLPNRESEKHKEESPVIVPTFYIESSSAVPSQKQVPISVFVKNNPGVSAIGLTLSYDNDLELSSIVYNTDLPGETMQPQLLKNPVKLIWICPFENIESDFVLATAYFNIPNKLDKKHYQVQITYDPNDVYELSENNIDFDIVQGLIEVLN